MTSRTPDPATMPVAELLRFDISWYLRPVAELAAMPRVGWLRILYTAWRFRGFRAILYYRWANVAARGGHRFISGFLARRMIKSTGAEICPTAHIGPGLRLPHSQGVIVSHDARLGAFVTLGQHSTIGGNFGRMGDDGRYFPTLGDGVVLTAGAVVAGPVHVGNGVIAGANTVIVKDVPEGAVVGGVPGEVIRISEEPTPGLAAARAMRGSDPGAAHVR